LIDLAQFYKRQDELSSKVSSAIVYPLVMLGVGSLTVIFILTFVLPKIAVIFADAHEQLPTPTIIVMTISQYVRLFWIPTFAAGAILFVGFNRWRKTNMGKIVIGGWLLRLPVIKDLVIKIDFTRFSRTTFLLLQSGLPLLRAIETAAQTMSNPQLRMDMLMTAEALSGGENFGRSLARCHHVPPIFIETLAVAEEGGHLKEAFADIADSCEMDVSDAIKTITTLLEPFMILAVGAVVGFIIFAMLLPIFSMDIMAR
jgi:general secretion pathway protein F